MAATLADLIGLVALGLWLGYEVNPVYLALVVAALLLDGLLGRPNRRRLLLAGAAAVVGVLLLGFAGEPLHSRLEPPVLALPAVLAAVLISALFAVTIRAAGWVHAHGDDTDEPLSPRRVRAAQILALLTGLAITLWHGDAGLIALLPLWAAMAGSGGYRLAARRKTVSPE